MTLKDYFRIKIPFLGVPDTLILSRIREISSRKVEIRRPGEGISSSHGARPVYLINTMIKWIRASGLPLTTSISEQVTVDKVMGMGPVMGAIGSVPHSLPSYTILYTQFYLPQKIFHPTQYSARPTHKSTYPTLCSVLENVLPVLYIIPPTQHSIPTYKRFRLSYTVS